VSDEVILLLCVAVDNDVANGVDKHVSEGSHIEIQPNLYIMNYWALETE